MPKDKTRLKRYIGYYTYEVFKCRVEPIYFKKLNTYTERRRLERVLKR